MRLGTLKWSMVRAAGEKAKTGCPGALELSFLLRGFV